MARHFFRKKLLLPCSSWRIDAPQSLHKSHAFIIETISVAKWTLWKYRRSLKIPIALSVMLWRGIQRFQNGPPVRLKKVMRFEHRNRQSFSPQRRH